MKKATMKKVIAGILMICLMGLCVACGQEEAQESTTKTEDTPAASDGTKAGDDSQSDSSESDGDATGTGESKTLVVYFSNTGNTRNIAEIIAAGVGADVYEIVAEEPYTDADLNYSDNNSRSTLEMNDTSTRPAISGSVENMDQYDRIYLGYPIWWGEAPRILDTFVESYDFTDKTIIPFSTSASSGMGSSADNLEALAGGGTWLEGQRFSGGEAEGEVMEWVNSL